MLAASVVCSLNHWQRGRIGSFWQLINVIDKGHLMVDPKGEILTLDEVSAYLKAGKRTVYRLAAERGSL